MLSTTISRSLIFSSSFFTKVVFIWEKTSWLQPGQPGALVSSMNLIPFIWEVSSRFAGINMSRGIVLSLAQFDFSYNSPILCIFFLQLQIFLGIFCCFSSKNLCFYHFYVFFWWNIRNRILTNQKLELVIWNCQWNCK